MNRGDAGEMSGRCNCAVSEVVGFILVLIIVTGAISFILFWGVPYMEQQSAKGRLDSALTQFDVINSIIRDEVIRQGNGSSSIVSFTTDAGNLNIDSKGERFIFYYSLDPNFDFNVSGLGDENDNQFNFIINQGSTLADHLWIRYLYNENFNELKYIISNPQTTTHALSDAVEICINTSTNSIIGRIWLFDTGSITYQTLSSSGTYKVIAENGGIISSSSQSGFLYDEPNIIIDNERLAMRIIQFKSVAASGGGGKATYKFTIKLNYSDIRVKSEGTSGSFRMQIYGDDAAVKAWTNYFNLTLGFKKFVGSPADGTLYLPGGRSFTLSQSICKISMEMSG